MKKHSVEIIVKESVQDTDTTYTVEAWLEGEATGDVIKLFSRVCRSFNVLFDPHYRMGWTSKEKRRTTAVSFSTRLAKAFDEVGFSTKGAIIRRDFCGKLEDALGRKPKIEKLPGLPLSKKALTEIPRRLLEILEEKAMEPI